MTFERSEIGFIGDVISVAKDDRLGGYAFFDNPIITLEFAQSNDMTIVGELGHKIEVNLKGTSKAAKKCQTKQPE